MDIDRMNSDGLDLVIWGFLLAFGLCLGWLVCKALWGLLVAAGARLRRKDPA
jgi:hypothetical protein